MKPVIFTLGEETKPKIESSSDISKSIFEDQYKKSFRWISDYLSKNGESGKETDNPNNILAYIGERGSGKTSCMMSVAEMLRNGEYAKEYPSSKENFYVLDVIDPSFFDSKNNILSIIIANLFSRFREEVEGKPNDSDTTVQLKKSSLLKCFQDANDNIAHLFSKEIKISEDSLQQIDNLAAAVNLQKSIQDLIRAFLVFFKKDILIIPVDDVDLHTKEAYVMVEQIRKYFVQPKVIILFAVKLDQLSLVIKREYAHEFGHLLKLKPSPNADDNILNINVIEEMVDRYLMKLIPLGQRIYLPDMSLLLSNRLMIVGRDGQRYGYNSVKEAVPTLIFQKTRFLFYNTMGTTSFIVPRNLRELRNMVYMLFDMKDYHEKDGDRQEYNKTLFKKYFFETWTVNNLNEQDQGIIKSLFSMTDAASFNKAVVSALKERFKLLFYEEPARAKVFTEYDYILKDDNFTYNVSIGDVMAIIRHIEQLTYKPNDMQLLFMIRSMYSIKLYEYYDETTDYYLSTYIGSINPLLRKDSFHRMSNYDKLLGGNFINSSQEIISLLPKEAGIEDRALRTISMKAIWDNMLVVMNSKNPQEIRTKSLRAVEFFALTLSRKSYSQDPKANKRYRDKTEPYYRTVLFGGGSAVFDIASVFANITNIKECYKRVHPKLYMFAYKTEGSVYRQFMDKTRLRMPNKELERLPYKARPFTLRNRMLSWVAIRNAEVLDDLTNYLVYDPRQSTPRGNREVIKQFFLRIQAYDRKTYDRNKKEEPHEIEFKWVGILIDVLNDMSDAEFENFYREKDLEFNIENLMKGLFQKKGNRKDTMIDRISTRYPTVYKSNATYIHSLFSEEKYMYDEMYAKLKELEAHIE